MITVFTPAELGEQVVTLEDGQKRKFQTGQTTYYRVKGIQILIGVHPDKRSCKLRISFATVYRDSE